MKAIIINNVDRQDITLHFGKVMILSFNSDVVIEKYKELFYNNLEFQLFFSEKHTIKYNLFKKCKVVNFNNNAIFFIYDCVADGLIEKDILPLIRKEKLKAINENT